MTAQGSPRTRFERALRSGDPLSVRIAAGELRRVELADAFAITAVLARADDPQWRRAGLRLLGRFSLEAGPRAELDDAAQLLWLLQARVPGDRLHAWEPRLRELGLEGVARRAARDADSARDRPGSFS